MENQLFALITPLLSQIHGQIRLNINSAGGLGCRFFEIREWGSGMNRKSGTEKKMQKSTVKTPCGNARKII